MWAQVSCSEGLRGIRCPPGRVYVGSRCSTREPADGLVCLLITFDGSIAVPALPHPGHGCFCAAAEEVGLVDSCC